MLRLLPAACRDPILIRHVRPGAQYGAIVEHGADEQRHSNPQAPRDRRATARPAALGLIPSWTKDLKAARVQPITPGRRRLVRPACSRPPLPSGAAWCRLTRSTSGTRPDGKQPMRSPAGRCAPGLLVGVVEKRLWVRGRTYRDHVSDGPTCPWRFVRRSKAGNQGRRKVAGAARNQVRSHGVALAWL